MDKKNKFPVFVIVSLLVILGAVLWMHGARDLPVLNPKGWIGIQQRDLILRVSSIMLLIVLPVVVLTIYFGWKYREGQPQAKYEPEWDNHWLIEAVWWGVPCVVIALFSVWVWKGSHQLDPYRPLESDARPIEIQVVALDWKWLFIYPEEQVATVNFIQFPENTPVNFLITSDAPMNSFWVPALGGQIYAMPGMKTKLHLIANEKGNYRGQSAHISGEGFAGMTFTAKASSQEEFEAWIQEVRQSGSSLDAEEYARLLAPSSYHPVAYYILQDRDLFDEIVMKYMMPMEKNDGL